MNKALLATTIIAIGIISTPALAGGGTGGGVIKTKIRGIVEAAATGARSGYLAVKYGLKSRNQPDIVHRDMAYMWGYDSGLTPDQAETARSNWEYAQGFAFVAQNAVGTVHPLVEPSPYEPLSTHGPGGGVDTLGDIAETRRGAEDREKGLAPNPPSAR